MKVNIDVAGQPTIQGTPMLTNAIAATNTPLVEQMKHAGMIPPGLTNMLDLGPSIDAESSDRDARRAVVWTPRTKQWQVRCQFHREQRAHNLAVQ